MTRPASSRAANAILPHPNVVFNIAQAYANAGQTEKAIAAYKTYLASDPPDRADVALVLRQARPEARAGREDGRGARAFKAGMELIGKGNYGQGIQELEKANEIAPHPNVLFNIARAEAAAGNR